MSVFLAAILALELNLVTNLKTIELHPKSWMFDKLTNQLGHFFGQVKDHRRSNATYTLSDSLKGAFAMFVFGAIIAFLVFWTKTSMISKTIFFIAFSIWLFARYQGNRLNEAEKAYGM